jgi:hypothetical protein
VKLDTTSRVVEEGATCWRILRQIELLVKARVLLVLLVGVKACNQSLRRVSARIVESGDWVVANQGLSCKIRSSWGAASSITFLAPL